MSFGIKNEPPTYQKTVTKTFKDYLDSFMKIFPNDFIMYSDMESHLQKLKLCFQKCRVYNINLNPDICIYGIFRDDLGFYCFQGKLPDPEKI
jgi:hypothetical protein